MHVFVYRCVFVVAIFFLLPRMIKVSLQGLGNLIKCKLKHERTEDHNIQ